MFFCFANAVDVCAHSLSLRLFILTPWAQGIRCLCVSVFMHEFVCLCVCPQSWVLCYLGSSDGGALKRDGYSSGSLRYCWLIGWGVSQANRPQTLMWHTGERERGSKKHTSQFGPNAKLFVHLHLLARTYTHMIKWFAIHFVHGASLILQQLLWFTFVQLLAFICLFMFVCSSL